MYTGEELNQLVTDILGNLTDQGKVSELLQNFREDYSTTLTNYSELETNKNTLESNYENLRNVNAKMMNQLGDLSFLSKGTQKEQEQKEIEQKEQESKEEPYSSLFNEDGELI